jgi:hypothetical protein
LLQRHLFTFLGVRFWNPELYFQLYRTIKFYYSFPLKRGVCYNFSLTSTGSSPSMDVGFFHILLTNGTSVVLIKCPLVPEIMHWGALEIFGHKSQFCLPCKTQHKIKKWNDLPFLVCIIRSKRGYFCNSF